MGSGFEIPHRGRSPDFVHHGVALPGFPVVCKTAPVHSDCIAPDSHRIPFSSAFWQTPLCYNFIFFQTVRLYHILSNCQSVLMAGCLKSIDSCMPGLLLSQYILPAVYVRNREANCRLSALALACLFIFGHFLLCPAGRS